eukprot:gb/GECH01001404.1/.p1 GENE.gb/GECH01001404.1/~~gb/GECH01001404.1/.p1  ORF type:complete len:359 (+),score=140.75 gb/GECH01001404.1/:1-1077(+)
MDVSINENNYQTNDDIKEQKSAAFQNRLKKREQERIEKKQEREQEKKYEELEFEKPEIFWNNFNNIKSKIEIQYKEESLEKLSEMQQILSKSQHFLSAYDIRVASDVLKDIRHEIDQYVEKQKKGKKRFAFSRKTKRHHFQQQQEDQKQEKDQKESQDTKREYSQGLNQRSNVSSQEEYLFGICIRDLNEQEKTVDDISHVATDKKQNDILISHCRKSRIVIKGISSAVHIVDCEACTIIIGPVAGSVFVRRSSNCRFVLAAQQIRVHSSDNSQFYVRVKTGPVIEHSTGITFAPYQVEYDGLEDHLQKAGLLNNIHDNNENKLEMWKEVKDFNWLKSGQPSPNWSIQNNYEQVQFSI